MRFPRFVAAMFLLSLLVAPLGARRPVGGFATWAAFCDEPRKCFAVSAPAERRGRPFLTVLVAGKDLRVQVHVGRALRTARIQIGHASFNLTVSGQQAYADAAASRRIVAAMRGSEALTVSGASTTGRFRHHYLLAGAPSAIDAAAIASMR